MVVVVVREEEACFSAEGAHILTTFRFNASAPQQQSVSPRLASPIRNSREMVKYSKRHIYPERTQEVKDWVERTGMFCSNVVTPEWPTRSGEILFAGMQSFCLLGSFF